MMRIVTIACLAALTLCSFSRADNNVPQFLAGRLPASDSGALPPERWSASENIVWKTDVPGVAWGSPIVWGKKIIVTTCVNSGVTPETRKGLYIEDVDANKYPKPKDKHEWRVLCLDLDSGKVLWNQLAHEAIPAKPHHIKNTLASETPTTDGERIYAYFGNVGLFVYDMDGKPLWKHPVEATETRYGWGTSSSPIVYRDRVYVVNDNEDQSYLLALDKKTGDIIWKIDREDEKTNYGTPFVWENDKRTELVTSGIGYNRSYDLDGKLLWKLKGSSILAIPTPQARFGNLYLAAGHVLWGENPVYAIRPGASGDITLGDKETTNDYIIWSYPKAGPYHPTPLILGDTMYILYDRGFLAAYDARTGREIYGRKRIPNGKAFTSSPWAYGGKLFALNEDGVTFVFKPGSEFEILHSNPLSEDDMGMATPVIVGDKLLVRTSARVYCVGDMTKTASAAP